MKINIHENRNVMIFNVSELSKIDFNEVLETSIETLRLSIDGTKTFVKWDGDDIPECISSLITHKGPYTYDEIMIILSTEEWTEKMIDESSGTSGSSDTQK
jgi:hypothetical protein